MINRPTENHADIYGEPVTKTIRSNQALDDRLARIVAQRGLIVEHLAWQERVANDLKTVRVQGQLNALLDEIKVHDNRMHNAGFYVNTFDYLRYALQTAKQIIAEYKALQQLRWENYQQSGVAVTLASFTRETELA